MVALRDLCQLFELVVATIQPCLFVMRRRLGLLLVIVFVLAIVVAQVRVVGQLANYPYDLRRMIVAARPGCADQSNEILDAELVLRSDGISLLLAELQQRASAGEAGERAVERGCKAMRCLARARKVIARGDICDSAEGRVLFAAVDRGEDLVPSLRLWPVPRSKIALVDAHAIDQRQVRQHIARSLALEERRAANGAVGDAATCQRDLQRCQVMIGAREHKDIVVRQALTLLLPRAHQLPDAGGDAVGLVLLIVVRRDLYLRAVRLRGAQHLLEARRNVVVADQAVRGVENLRRRAIVLLDVIDLTLRIHLLERNDRRLGTGPAELVDRLVWIADDDDVLPGCGEVLDELILRWIGILRLV